MSTQLKAFADRRTGPVERFVAAELHRLGYINDPAEVTEFEIEAEGQHVTVRSRTVRRRRGADAVAQIDNILERARELERAEGDRERI